MIVRDTKDPEAGFVKAALTSALGDRDLDARRAIALALANFDPDPGIVLVPVLIDGTGQGSPEARAGAVEGPAPGTLARASPLVVPSWPRSATPKLLCDFERSIHRRPLPLPRTWPPINPRTHQGIGREGER